MIGTHLPLYLLAVVVIIVMCFDWWWWWCSVFTSHNHQSSMTPEKTQQTTQWQVSLLASRTPPHSSPMQTWGKIRKWKIFFARRTRRSCHCSSLQSDPCHPGGNPQATWTCIGKFLNIFVWSILFSNNHKYPIHSIIWCKFDKCFIHIKYHQNGQFGNV